MMKMVSSTRVVVAFALVSAVAADTDCPTCNTDDAQALLQSNLLVQKEQAKVIETVDDIDMAAWGLLPQHLDKANTKIIAGVPILNYGRAFEGGMNPSLLELAEPKTSIETFPETVTDADIATFCECVQQQPGNAHCIFQGHPSSLNGLTIVEMSATAIELKAALETCKNIQPKFAEMDMPVHMDPEVLEKDLAQHERDAIALIDSSSMGVVWGLDRIDDPSGLDGSYDLPSSSSQGQGAHVYIADTGIRITHSDFGGRAEASHDALSGLKVCSPTDNTCAYDGHGHGTHCAGTVGGTQYGVAKKTKLYAAKVLGDSGGGSFSGVLRSIDYVIEHGKKPAVWSASLGGKGVMSSLESAFQGALKAGVVVSVAAGNSNDDACLYSPAFSSTAITVGASSSPNSAGKDPRASFSNYGKCIDIFAPGVGILSAGHASDTATKSMSGTSMACPHVSGAIALLLGDGVPVTDIAAKLSSSGSQGTVSDAKTGTPNIMLKVGGPDTPATPTDAPTTPPTNAPTMPPTAAPTMPPNMPPTYPPTTAPTQAPTQPPTTAPTQPPKTDLPPPSYKDQIMQLAAEAEAGFAALNKKVTTATLGMDAKFASLEEKVEMIKTLMAKRR
jgi:hypothetical protein